MSLTGARCDTEIFQPSLIKVDTNVYWNWLADLKALKSVCFWKKLKSLIMIFLKKTKTKQLYIGKWVIFSQVCFSKVYECGLLWRNSSFFVLPGWLVQLCMNEWKLLQATSTTERKSPRRQQCLSGVKLCVTLKAICKDIWYCMLGCTLVKLLFISVPVSQGLFREFSHNLWFFLLSTYGMTDQKLLKSPKKLI